MEQAGSAMDFFILELRRQPGRGSPEGNARLLAEAKPLIERIRAPRLRAQIAHAVAGLTGLVPPSPREAERMLGLAPLPGATRPVAVASQITRRAPASLVHRLLRLVLRHPAWCAALPLQLIPEGDADADALRAIADAVEHGELPAGGLGTALEFFRDTEHEPVLAGVARELAAESVEDAALESELNDIIDQLKRAGIHQEIASLSARARGNDLSADERRRLAELLAEKQRLAPTSGEAIPGL